jgi:hypothetical protein
MAAKYKWLVSDAWCVIILNVPVTCISILRYFLAKMNGLE